MEAMGTCNEALVAAGIMLAGEGLNPLQRKRGQKLQAVFEAQQFAARHRGCARRRVSLLPPAWLPTRIETDLIILHDRGPTDSFGHDEDDDRFALALGERVGAICGCK
jgi:hypothetical protein